MSEYSVDPTVRAGDPFFAAGRPPLDLESPHGCYGGVVYLGELVITEDGGEEEEVLYPVLCRRCLASTNGQGK